MMGCAYVTGLCRSAGSSELNALSLVARLSVYCTKQICVIK